MSKQNVKDTDQADTTIMLNAAITAHGEEVTNLTLRKPMGKDIREIGLPYKFAQDESVSVQTDIVSKYISRLASIPMSSVDQLSPGDMNILCWAVVGFFLNAGSTPNS